MIEVLRSGGRGPAAARNVGWRASEAEWIAFLDDDVAPTVGWTEALAADLAAAGERTAGVQGRIVVPLPADRRPTDWERNVAGLERARWATADMAYRRGALRQVGGFDERFGRNYREDADLGLRITNAGWEIRSGRAHDRPPGRAGESVDQPEDAGRQRRRRADASHPRSRLARARRSTEQAASHATH